MLWVICVFRWIMYSMQAIPLMLCVLCIPRFFFFFLYFAKHFHIWCCAWLWCGVLEMGALSWVFGIFHTTSCRQLTPDNFQNIKASSCILRWKHTRAATISVCLKSVKLTVVPISNHSKCEWCSSRNFVAMSPYILHNNNNNATNNSNNWKQLCLVIGIKWLNNDDGRESYNKRNDVLDFGAYHCNQ